MAKMGFSTPTTPFRPSSFSPPYFWFCRSCTQFYSFSSSSRVFCRLEDRAPQSANGRFPSGARNADILELNQRSSYGTFQHNESEMYHRQRNNFTYSQWKTPYVHREVKRREEDSMEIRYGLTAEDWGKATEECKMSKRLYAHRSNTSVNLKTLPEEDIAEKTKPGSRKIYKREGSGSSRMEKEYTGNVGQNGLRVSHNQKSLVQVGSSNISLYTNDDDNKMVVEGRSMTKVASPNAISSDSVSETLSGKITASGGTELHERLSQVYDKVLVVDSIPAARDVVKMLTTPLQKNLIHACDTEVWHNYSFDNHVIENYGIKVSGFYADTMHMARLWNSARRTEGGYSLEALTGDSAIMSDAKSGPGETVTGKVSMKNIFGRKKLKKDGSEGKLITIPPVEELQRVERKLWICYSALDSISTLRLYESLEKKLSKTPWSVDGQYKGSMFNNYEKYLRPFGELLVKMETEGMLVDRSYLAEIEKVAKAEQQVAADRFRKWASKYCPDAKYMNVGSDAQLRQLFFGGKEFKVPNVDNIIEEGKKSPTKYRKIILRKPDHVNIETDKYTASGWPSVSGDVLKSLAGKVSADFDFLDEENDEELPENVTEKSSEESEATPGVGTDTSAYGAAYSAFGGGQAGIEACHAIAALCEVCSIDSLISNFILPLQLELRILAHLANCKSMLDAFKAGGDFHSRTAMNMYPHIRDAVERKDVLLEWHPQSGEDKPPVPLLKDAFASERRKAKMLNFSIAYGKTTVGLARDWKVSREEAQETVNLWYSDRQEVLSWQEKRKQQARQYQLVYTLLGRARHFPSLKNCSSAHKHHIERAAINTPVQVHDEVILEGPTESAEEAKAIVVDCMSKPFDGENFLRVDLSVDAKCAQNWYSAK
ncbi:hypothetical protein DH2020_033346 [Rehmannia glutinosa]|uniref:DNA-directed DNA polymerase family A palm domain-containing protein n=1 Tax=Rehmannia glutinosa TaxID=99300 RepID=A0ABR0VGG1_REHGL